MERDDDQATVVFQNIQNFMSSDPALKLNSIQQLGLIVEALGQPRTIEELFPYLEPLLEEDEDILKPFAQHLT